MTHCHICNHLLESTIAYNYCHNHSIKIKNSRTDFWFEIEGWCFYFQLHRGELTIWRPPKVDPDCVFKLKDVSVTPENAKEFLDRILKLKSFV